VPVAGCINEGRAQVRELVERFGRNLDAYKRPDHNNIASFTLDDGGHFFKTGYGIQVLESRTESQLHSSAPRYPLTLPTSPARRHHAAWRGLASRWHRSRIGVAGPCPADSSPMPHQASGATHLRGALHLSPTSRGARQETRSVEGTCAAERRHEEERHEEGTPTVRARAEGRLEGILRLVLQNGPDQATM